MGARDFLTGPKRSSQPRSDILRARSVLDRTPIRNVQPKFAPRRPNLWDARGSGRVLPCIIQQHSIGPGIEITMLEGSRARVSFVSRRRIAIVVLAICSITASLATRFLVVGPELHQATSIQSQSTVAKRQHLLGKALQWTAPPLSFILFQTPRPVVLKVSLVIPSTSLGFEICLHSRPPPSWAPSSFAA
jgi:hypothetical protein